MRSMVSATQAVPVNVYLVDSLLIWAAGLLVPGTQVMEFAPGVEAHSKCLLAETSFAKLAHDQL